MNDKTDFPLKAIRPMQLHYKITTQREMERSTHNGGAVGQLILLLTFWFRFANIKFSFCAPMNTPRPQYGGYRCAFDLLLSGKQHCMIYVCFQL